MRALTICQPYAHLIMLPDDHGRVKRVENRNWSTSYRGPLLIHAGKSKDYLSLDPQGIHDVEYMIPFATMTFGAIVGVCNVVDCFSQQLPMDRDCAIRRRPWLAGHEHVEGPFCFVLQECRKFVEPIPYRGAQGFFNVPDELVAEQLSAIASTL